jgi:hypothetical protein
MALVLFASGGALSGQAAGRDELRSEIRLVREQLDRLEQRLSEFESRAPVDPNTSAPATAPDGSSSQVVETVIPAPPPPETSTELSAFLASRWINTGLKGPAATYQVHTASLFFGKTYGNWSFHSEMEFDYLPELAHGSIPTGASKGEVELETAWLNYKKRDWLNMRAGILITPNYWRLHNYSSTTMTVQAPLLYETVFPPNVAGIMIHGSKYFEDNGFTYSVYAGQGREFLDSHHNSRNAAGASFLAHLPSRRWLKTFDIGVHHYRDRIDQGRRTIWGFESHIERDRFGLLSEFAHSRIGSGSGRDLVQGYYLQPSVRMAGQLYGVYRYDRLHPGGGETKVERHTFGVLYRPLPAVALKLEWNRYPSEPASPARNGLAAGVSIFVR